MPGLSLECPHPKSRNRVVNRRRNNSMLSLGECGWERLHYGTAFIAKNSNRSNGDQTDHAQLLDSIFIKERDRITHFMFRFQGSRQRSIKWDKPTCRRADDGNPVIQ